MSKEFNTIEIDEYNGVQAQVYNGVWGILSMKKGGGENITWYKKWVFLSKRIRGKALPMKQLIPVAVRLGDKAQAIETLETIIKQIKGEVG